MHVPPTGATAIRYPCVQMAVGTLVTVLDPPSPSTPGHTRTRVDARTTRRGGVTLLELLVVLALLAISAAVVLPALRPPAITPVAAEDALVTATRRTAIARGELVRLRLEGDGTWGVVGARTGVVIDTGRISAHPRTLDITVDARGSCAPVASKRTASTGTGATNATSGLSFDPLACRTRSDSAR